ncbi:MAG: hypothetical protein B5M51_00915 [Anaerolinea sp. 4484_236]|nr:MAG: hypothetical protein B5M51_00915 [Anaerolinea sp. 4484_236]
MKASAAKNRNQIVSIAIWAIPILLYIFILIIKIPYSFSSFFRYYSVTLFFLTLILYYFSFRLPGNLGQIAGFSVTMILFALALSYMWSSGFSDNGILGGLLPYKDGYYYYNGARLLSIGHLLPRYAVQAADRPLFPSFISSLFFLTRNNFQWTLAILVGTVSSSCFFSAWHIRKKLGVLAASVYSTFLFFYIQPLIGYSLTELLGFAFGCLGFVLLWKAAETLSIRDLVLGIFTLMVGVSARAGAFFIFPMLILWAGWAFRGQNKFSFRLAGITLVTVIISYLAVNTIYPRLVVEPGNQTFGSFSYMIYGQVKGGAGWHSAIKDLGTRDPEVALRAAAQNFRAHPVSLLIGVAKSYRDFFSPGEPGVFSFYSPHGNSGVNILLWITGLALLIWGGIVSARQKSLSTSSLCLAAFLGIFLSIPFLPPVDGGRRFHASTMPFFFILPTIAISEMFPKLQHRIKDFIPDRHVHIPAILLILLTVVAPVFIQKMSAPPTIPMITCPPNQVPFAVEVNPGSYIDLVKNKEESFCGYAPKICLSDFEANGIEKNIDDFYVELISQAHILDTTTRVFPANDLVDDRLLFFLGTTDQLRFNRENRLVTGCATEIEIQTQNRPSIYKVESSSAISATQ